MTTHDRYVRGVLTIIAGALVYLCVLATPWPAAEAQTARRPGDPTGPAEMVIVGVRGTLPVQVQNAIGIAGEVKVTGDVRVTGRVQTEQVPRTSTRVVLAGWEDASAPAGPLQWNRTTQTALPVVVPSPR